jgi:hypothetical protein
MVAKVSKEYVLPVFSIEATSILKMEAENSSGTLITTYQLPVPET